MDYRWKNFLNRVNQINEHDKYKIYRVVEELLKLYKFKTLYQYLFLAQLKKYAAAKNYKYGWVIHKFMEKFSYEEVSNKTRRLVFRKTPERTK